MLYRHIQLQDYVRDTQGSYGVWKSMEKRKQSMEKYLFPDFCPYLVF